MYRFIEKTKGAVSVFLVIVLVPMLTVAALFVDASKMELAKALTVSAGDLTMNTALTDYDIQLKDLYGILATAQDTSKLYGDLEKYYATCIKSSGLSDSDADDIAQMLINALRNTEGSDDVADLLNMQVSDFKVEKVEGANLANAALLERNIVDFMKYRSPINTGLSFITSLKSFTTLSEQTKLVDCRQDYYEAEQEMMEDALEAYRYLYKYSKDGLYTETDYKNLQEVFFGSDGSGGVAKDFYGIVETVIKDEYQTKDYGKAPRRYYGTDVSADRMNDTSVDEILGYIDVLNTAIDDYDSFVSNSEAYAYINRYNESGMYYPRYITELNRYGYYDEWITAARKVYKAKANVHCAIRNAEIAVEKGAYYKDETTSPAIYDPTHDIDVWEKYNDTSAYDNAMENFNSFRNLFTGKNSNFVNKLSPYGHSANQSGITSRLTTAVGKIKTWQNTIDQATGDLENAKKKLQAVINTVSSGGKVYNAKTDWTNAANKDSLDGTAMAEQDRAEIANINEYIDVAEVQDLIDRIDIILYGSVNGKESDRKGLKGLQYQIKNDFVFAPNGGSEKPIVEIKDYATLVSLLEKNNNENLSLDERINLSSLNDFISKNCTGAIYFKYPDGSKAYAPDFSWIGADRYPINFISTRTEQENAADGSSEGNAFYMYLVEHYADSVAETTGSVKVGDTAGAKKMSEIKGTIKAETKTTTATNSFPASSNEDIIKHVEAGSYPSNTTNVPNLETMPSAGTNSGDPDKAAGEASGGLSAMFDCLAKTLLTFGADLRDKLYIADYAISMFSYDTIEAEFTEANKKGSSGTVSGSSASGSTTASGSSSVGSGAASGNSGHTVSASGMYVPESTSAAAAPQEVNESAILAPASTSSSASGPIIQSLTLNPISASTNYGYGREVEYIIYGGTNSGNVAAAYASIFAIRLGFNIIYAFTSSEVRETAFSVAVPLSAATMGIVPVPLFQAAIIIGIACIESGIDLVELSQGKEVPLFKTQETWHCSVQGLINTGKAVVQDIAEDAVDKGAGLLTELLDATDEELSTLISDETGKLETYVDTIVEESILRQANTVIEKVTSLATEAYEAAILNPSLDQVEYVQSRLTEWRNSIGTSGNGYIDEILRSAIDAVTDDLIEALVDAIETAHQSYDETITEAVKKASNSIEEVVNVIREKIKNAISYGSDTLTSYKNRIVADIKTSISSGADDLKATLNQYVDGMFGSSAVSGSSSDSVNSSDENSFLASLLSFAYSDYLKLFLLIGLYANEEALVLRIGDVIQADMGKITEDVNYQLSDASSYVRITATLRVKPTFLALPMFADVENNPATNSNWYSFQYTSIKGY